MDWKTGGLGDWDEQEEKEMMKECLPFAREKKKNNTLSFFFFAPPLFIYVGKREHQREKKTIDCVRPRGEERTDTLSTEFMVAGAR